MFILENLWFLHSLRNRNITTLFSVKADGFMVKYGLWNADIMQIHPIGRVSVLRRAKDRNIQKR